MERSPWTLYADECRLVCGERFVGLTPTYAGLLECLALKKGKVAREDFMIAFVWDRDEPEHPENTLKVHVSKLNKILDRLGIPRVCNAWHVGYYLPVILPVVKEKCCEACGRPFDREEVERAA